MADGSCGFASPVDLIVSSEKEMNNEIRREAKVFGCRRGKEMRFDFCQSLIRQSTYLRISYSAR